MNDGERVAGMRRVYRNGDLSESGLAGTWWEQFDRWFAEAVGSGLLVEPNAMVLATVGEDGRPAARTVLLKGYDEHGFVFYTNYQSRKGRALATHPYASLVFSWVPLERQVLVGGTVRRVSREQTAGYFGTRPYRSRLAAWASPQSAVIESREQLEGAVAELAARWPEGTEIPPPPHWGGYLVIPDTVEFWQGRQDRLHDRLRFRLGSSAGWAGGSAGGPAAGAAGGAAEWLVERLAP